jgi:PAS domain S-box-containing protein
VGRAKAIASEGQQLDGLLEIFTAYAPIGVSIVQNGKIRFANSEFERISGYSRDELKAMDSLDLVLPEDRDSVKKKTARMLNGGPLSPYECRILSKDRAIRWITQTFGPIQYKGGRAALVFSMDTTERRQAAEKSAEVIAGIKGELIKLEKIISASPYQIYLYDRKGRYLYTSPAAARMFGLESGGMVGKTWRDLKMPAKTMKPYEAQLRKVFATGKSVTGELTLPTVEGERDYEFTLTPIHGPDGSIEAVVGAKRDITEENRLRENLYFYIREITRAQEEERKRIARELHDETIQALAALILDIADISGEAQLPEVTKQRLQKLSATINSVLEEVRRFCHELRPGLLERLGLIASLGILTDDLTACCGINCSLQIIGSERQLSSEAELMLFRIVQEALRNVKKHSGATNAVVRVEFNREKVKVDVSDNGDGFRLPEDISDFARQVKLGLIGIKERTRLLNGSLRVHSTIGHGTTVTVEVPALINL